MRTFIFVSTLAACTVASPALAEDGDWTGPYVGVHAGYTGAKSDSAVTLGDAWASESQALRDEVTAGWSTKQSVNDMNFGAQIGYNYDMGGAVLGLEADISALSGKNVSSRGPIATVIAPSLTYTYGNTIDPKHMMSLRAKVGAAMGDTLFYAHGGWAWTKAEMAAEIVSNGGYTKEGRIDKTLNGYIVGAGIEQRFGSNVSARLEYSYTDQGDETYATDYRAGSTFTSPVYSESATQDLRMHLVRVGLNYNF